MQQETDTKTRAKVNIFDCEYIVRADEAPEYIAMLAASVDRKMRKIAQGRQNMPSFKVAVLTALNLADELYKLQNDYEALVRLIEEEKRL